MKNTLHDAAVINPVAVSAKAVVSSALACVTQFRLSGGLLRTLERSLLGLLRGLPKVNPLPVLNGVGTCSLGLL